ncbi:MAG: phage holin family protein [Oscillospiraceae bacterium]|nr:phage holin family protein [Oscillospiraceae bacterium]
MEYLELLSVPVIAGAVFVCLQLLKRAVGGNERLLRFLPLIAAGVGASLGVTAFFTMPEIIPASNVFLALLIGGSSGLAATGSHQAWKQLTKGDKKDEKDGGA